MSDKFGGIADKYGESVVSIPMFQCILLFLITLYMLWGYVDRKNTPWVISIIVLVCWFVSLSLLVFIPLDIYLNLDETEDTLLTYWKITYWGSNFFCWLILPLLQGYVMAGEFLVHEKIYRSIVMNVPYYFFYFCNFIVLLLIIFYIDG